jgi:hypothetical protein
MVMFDRLPQAASREIARTETAEVAARSIIFELQGGGVCAQSRNFTETGNGRLQVIRSPQRPGFKEMGRAKKYAVKPITQQQQQDNIERVLA